MNIKIPDGEIKYIENFLNKKEADTLFHKILENTPWQHDKIKIFGKEVFQPRLTSLHGSNLMTYSYSGITMKPKPMTSELVDIEKKLADFCDEKFTTVLLNLYRHGSDSNGWHSDNEPELGINPIIASVSLGSERYFHMKHIHTKEKIKFLLKQGSLLIMGGSTQHFWKHQIAKTKKIVGKRINLTFRKIKKIY